MTHWGIIQQMGNYFLYSGRRSLLCVCVSVAHTFMKSTAEIGGAVTLVLANTACLSLGVVLAALTPHTQLPCTALLVLGAGLEDSTTTMEYRDVRRTMCIPCTAYCTGIQSWSQFPKVLTAL